MHKGRFVQTYLKPARLTVPAPPVTSLRALSYRLASSGPSPASRVNVDHAFTSVSSALDIEGTEDSRKTQQSRIVSAQAAPAVSYGNEEVTTVGEVDYEASMRNNIQILGNLGKDVEYRVLATNRLANFSLAISNKTQTDWVDIEAWGSLAESASQQLGKGARVAIQGRLKQDKWTDPDGKSRSRLKVVANSINKVRSSYGSSQQGGSHGTAYAEPSTSAPGIDQTYNDQSYQHMDQEYAPPPPSQQYTYPQAAQTSFSQSSFASNATEEKWKRFFQDRSRYWDNRHNKRNPKAPDFKHKEDGESLWLSSAPQWAQDEVNVPDLGGPVF